MTDSLLTLRAHPLTLAVEPELGGAITRFELHSKAAVRPLFRPATPEALRTEDPLGMASFSLVPFSNRIANGEYSYAGQRYVMAPNLPGHPHPLHGHGWRRRWNVVELRETRATLALDYDGEDWPAPYRAEQRFELDPRGLTVELVLHNRGKRSMPAGLGLHPYFPRLGGVRLTTSTPRVWLSDELCIPHAIAETPPSMDFTDGLEVTTLELDHCFSGFTQRARLDWTDGVAVEITADPMFGHLVVYVPRGEDYFCVEPVTHANDAVNLVQRGVKGTGLITLGPGETLSGTVRVALAS